MIIFRIKKVMFVFKCMHNVSYKSIILYEIIYYRRLYKSYNPFICNLDIFINF